MGWGIDDSLFGMRLYPICPLIEVLESTRYARRFDFDPEVAVRLAWKGVPIINLPTPLLVKGFNLPPADMPTWKFEDMYMLFMKQALGGVK